MMLSADVDDDKKMNPFFPSQQNLNLHIIQISNIFPGTKKKLLFIRNYCLGFIGCGKLLLLLLLLLFSPMIANGFLMLFRCDRDMVPNNTTGTRFSFHKKNKKFCFLQSLTRSTIYVDDRYHENRNKRISFSICKLTSAPDSPFLLRCHPILVPIIIPVMLHVERKTNYFPIHSLTSHTPLGGLYTGLNSQQPPYNVNYVLGYWIGQFIFYYIFRAEAIYYPASEMKLKIARTLDHSAAIRVVLLFTTSLYYCIAHYYI